MAEMLAFPLLFLLSFLFFRSLVASALPLMIGGMAIVGTFLILRIASEFASVSIFALNLTTAICSGSGWRSTTASSSSPATARRSPWTGRGWRRCAACLRPLAARTFFSSLTVAAALASLLVFPQRFLYSMGLGGSLVALFAALISLTVLPAVLTLLGTRVNSFAPRFLQRRAEADTRPDEHGFWYRLSRFVHAPSDPGGDGQRHAVDRHGHPLLQHQVQHAVDADGLAELRQRPPGIRRAQQRIPALSRSADLGRRRRRRPRQRPCGSRRRCAG